MATVLNHPRLGEVLGAPHESEEVVQYLGIQYATLGHRFASAEVKTEYGGKVDATSWGPSVVSAPVACDIEFGLIQKSLDRPTPPPISDTEGLNLNITVPKGTSEAAKGNLPVLVFVHGGGFAVGGTWAPHIDLSRLVAFSASIGKPIVGVSINYRLGVPGFLDSKEFRAAGILPNRGLLDQAASFRWVRQNIAGFGGDPNHVTAIGQSAGGSSVIHLLNLEQVDEPLFDRVICLSGNPMVATILPESVAQGAFQAVLGNLGIDSALPVVDQIAALTAASHEDLLTKVPMSVPLGPVVDEEQLPTFKAMQSKAPVKRGVPLMIGSTDLDGAIFEVFGIFAGRDESTLVEDFESVLQRVIPAGQHASLTKLLNAYGLASSSAPKSENPQRSILLFGTDLKYFTSTQSYAASWPASSWKYYFQEANPWEGPHRGHSAHCLDIAYLFLNYSDHMNESQLTVASALASDVLTFTRGQDPWPEYRSSQRVRVYGQAKNSVEDDQSVGPTREVRQLWEEVGLDALVQAYDAYLFKQ
ncbi:hypothetical protein NLU13_5178 [Sarocladium strictum]|uniref:Carboxylesterase type B domain-containing protein n=1 Tax=Sarocladium strictum TaxID=5046 RepID=A0AA39GGE4_SARSR|nr:hypothetical protein NLU13_5178 [Sarocladium strictum]